MINDAQNGFWKLRSCIAHIYALKSIIRNRLLLKKVLFVNFVDFAKAFDGINHSLLWYRLLNNGISGKIYHIIKTLYTNAEAKIALSITMKTSYFTISQWVKQGDS